MARISSDKNGISSVMSMVHDRATLSVATSPFFIAVASDLTPCAGVVALLHRRQHTLAEIGQAGEVALAAEQLAAKLLLEPLDRARQRRLGNVALLRRPREVERARRTEKIADLVHFHRMRTLHWRTEWSVTL